MANGRVNGEFTGRFELKGKRGDGVIVPDDPEAIRQVLPEGIKWQGGQLFVPRTTAESADLRPGQLLRFHVTCKDPRGPQAEHIRHLSATAQA